MFTLPISCLGDPSTHGGVVITASGFVTINGKRVTVTGDLHSCPIHGHGITGITASSSLLKVNGISVVRQGDFAGCGAAIIPLQVFTQFGSGGGIVPGSILGVNLVLGFSVLQ